MSKRRLFTWTVLQIDKLNKVLTILEELRDYKPLTLRQIYYQLVGKGFIENKVSQYGMLSGLLKHARLDGYISWDDIEDRVRTFHDLTGWRQSEDYIKTSIRRFLTGYQRDLLQSQNIYPEIWIEKDALSSIFTRVATPYTVPVVVCRGFSSVSFLNDYKERLSHHEGKEPVLLYFGDFDPSGMEILTAMETTLRDELNVKGIAFKRVALLKDDIARYRLPHSPEALKKTDTRASKHIAEYGEIAVELDALNPAVLEAKIREAIEAELDLDLFNAEQETNLQELDKLNGIKKQVTELVSSIIR
jgi:hypothetical protein